MRSTKLSQFRRSIYEKDSALDPRTLRSRIDAGLIPSGFRDEMGRYWVDMDKFEDAPELKPALDHINDPLARKAIGL